MILNKNTLKILEKEMLLEYKKTYLQMQKTLLVFLFSETDKKQRKFYKKAIAKNRKQFYEVLKNQEALNKLEI